MSLKQDIYDEIRKNHNMITTAQILALGYSGTQLSRYVKQGLLKRNRHGIYVLPNDEHDNLYTLSLRSNRLIFSHETALFLNNLSNEAPSLHCVTIPSNTTLPASIIDECTCFYSKTRLYHLGLSMRKTSFGNAVKCYNEERTICDMLRSRTDLNNEKISTVINHYMAYEKKNMVLLATYAKLFNVNRELKRYIDIC